MAASAAISTAEPDPLAPVVLVGQARSGSSLATLLVNRAGGFAINDAYAAQAAEALGLPAAGRDADAARLARFREAMLARLEARSVPEADGPIHRSARLTPRMRAAAAEASAYAAAWPGADWATVWGAMLHAAAAAGGAPVWGWNTPPDHTRAAEILAAFPRARFVFVHRGLWAVLRSYKGLPAHWGRERARFHPALQARAWAAATRAEARLAAALPGRVHRLDHAELVARPAETLSALAGFLGLPAPAPDLAAIAPNGSDRAALTRAEIWAARLGAGAEGRRAAGPPPEAPPGLGLGDLARASLRAAGYYGAEALRSPDMRGRIARMLRA